MNKNVFDFTVGQHVMFMYHGKERYGKVNICNIGGCVNMEMIAEDGVQVRGYKSFDPDQMGIIDDGTTSAFPACPDLDFLNVRA